jgi:hypothetical protein
MQAGTNMRKKSEDVPEWKPVRELTDNELEAYLDQNNVIDPQILAIIVSELLRRKWRKKVDE